MVLSEKIVRLKHTGTLEMVFSWCYTNSVDFQLLVSNETLHLAVNSYPL